jgi:hypothetical protein
LLALLAVAAVVLSLLLNRAEPYVRARIVAALVNRFHARVELDSFHLSLVNGLWAEGKGLRIWPPAQVEGITVPGPAKPLPGKPKPGATAFESGAQEAASSHPASPLIRLEEFRFHAPLLYRPGQPFHIALVELKGLVIDLPPRSHLTHAAAPVNAAATNTGSAPATNSNAATGTDSGAAASKPSSGAAWLSFQVDSIECSSARLVLETSKPGKLPLEIAIARLKLSGIAAANPAATPISFTAELTNPRPTGTIHTEGSIGPWQVADPGETPVAGSYRFEHANLADFKGIAGILSSTGRYQGTLRDLTVDGQTETPDFRLTHFGNALSLSTRFHAIVDGTDGDTRLEPVDATLGRSHFTTQGQIVRVLESAPGPPHSIGHDIALTVNVDRAQIEDFLRLASHSPTPLLTGSVTMKFKLHIPSGAAPVHERLQLKGSFSLDQARFTSAKIQARIAELSLRGEGRIHDLKTTDPESILLQMQGNFQLMNRVLTLSPLYFTVPGAQIQLQGAYGLEGDALDFTGTARMQAPVSKIVGGWKGLLLKPADRFFKKDGAATEVPIHIQGTREEPKFGIDFGRLKSTSPEQPGGNPQTR